jgi:hypothetical protein
MSTNVHYTQISDPQLLDIVDEAWLRDKLPDDSKQQLLCLSALAIFLHASAKQRFTAASCVPATALLHSLHAAFMDSVAATAHQTAACVAGRPWLF